VQASEQGIFGPIMLPHGHIDLGFVSLWWNKDNFSGFEIWGMSYRNVYFCILYDSGLRWCVWHCQPSLIFKARHLNFPKSKM
jgi:hypothetical protein